MNKTSIEWTDSTWNPLRGCSRVSEGCRNCYAEKVAYRFSGAGKPYEGLAVLKNGHASWTGKVELVEKHLLDPLKWGSLPLPANGATSCNTANRRRRYGQRPRRIFVNSMSDLFHESVPDEWIDQIFAVMALCPQHVFQVLTKRPERMLRYLTSAPWGRIEERVEYIAAMETNCGRKGLGWPKELLTPERIPLRNVWLGVSVENQKAADERIPLLLQTPAAVRFISAEPLLGQLDLTRIDWVEEMKRDLRQKVKQVKGSEHEPVLTDMLKGVEECRWEEGRAWRNALTGAWFDGWDGNDNPELSHATIDWVIGGGESGPGARPMQVEWVRSIVEQCRAAGVPCFVKQMGAKPAYRKDDLNSGLYGFDNVALVHDPAYPDLNYHQLKDRKGGDPEEWPEDVRVRQFPAVLP